jgi:hypothetical protein
LRGRDDGVEKTRYIQPIVSRDKAPARNPANSALFARHREISVCIGLQRIAEIDLLGWLFVALVVVVTASAWMIAYNASNVTISTTVLAGSPG